MAWFGWFLCPDSCTVTGWIEEIPDDVASPDGCQEQGHMIGGTIEEGVPHNEVLGGWDTPSGGAFDCNKPQATPSASYEREGEAYIKYENLDGILTITSSLLHQPPTETNDEDCFGDLAIPTGGLKICRPWGGGPIAKFFYRNPWFFKKYFQKRFVPAHIYLSARPSDKLPLTKTEGDKNYQLYFEWDVNPRIEVDPDETDELVQCAISTLNDELLYTYYTTDSQGTQKVKTEKYKDGYPLTNEDRIAGFIVHVPLDIAYGLCGGLEKAGVMIPKSQYVGKSRLIVEVKGIKFSYKEIE